MSPQTSCFSVKPHCPSAPSLPQASFRQVWAMNNLNYVSSSTSCSYNTLALQRDTGPDSGDFHRAGKKTTKCHLCHRCPGWTWQRLLRRVFLSSSDIKLLHRSVYQRSFGHFDRCTRWIRDVDFHLTDKLRDETGDNHLTVLSSRSASGQEPTTSARRAITLAAPKWLVKPGKSTGRLCRKTTLFQIQGQRRVIVTSSSEWRFPSGALHSFIHSFGTAARKSINPV